MSLTPPRPVHEIIANETKSTAQELAEQQSALPYHVAFVIDGVVQNVFHIEEKLAAVLLSDPVIVQCKAPLDGGPDADWKYDDKTGEFTKP